MAITSPGLAKAANDALVAISPDINVLSLFATDFSSDVADYGTAVKVPIAAATAAEVNLAPGEGETLNDYETDSASVTYATVTLNKQPKATFEAPAAAVFEAPNAPYWKRVQAACAGAVDGSISTTLGGLFTSTACTGGKVVVASVTKATIAGIRSSCKGRVGNTVLGLEPGYYATLLSLLDTSAYGGAEAIRNGYIPGLYGFKAVVQLGDLPEGIKGAIVPDTAVAVAARATLKDFTPFVEGDVVADEWGLPLTVTRHFAFAKRKEFLNVDLLYGMALAQPTKVQYIAAS